MDVAREARWGRVHETFPEDPVQIRAVASEGDELSQRLAAESVTLLKNEKNLLPLSRDLGNVAVIGPLADSTMVGFPAYTYPAALAMIRARFTGEEIAMAGADTGSSNVPSESQAAMVAEMQDYLEVNLDDYVRSNYPAVSLAEAVRSLLPDAEVTPLPGRGSCRRHRPTSLQQWPRPRTPTCSSSTSAGIRHGPAKSAPKARGRIARVSTCRRSRWSW
jgi:hypothetical protein